MQSLSWIPKPSSLQSGIVSTKPLTRKIFPRSSSPLILSIWPRKYLTHYHISSKFTQWPYSAIFISSLLTTKTIWLNSGSVLVDSTRIYTKLLIKIQRPSIPCPYTLAKCYGITVGKSNVIISWTLGKWPSKLQMAKEDNFSTYLMITSMLLNLLMLKKILGSNYLDIQTRYVHMLWEQLSIMLWLVNTDLDFSWIKNLSTHVELTPSNQGDIFFIIV